jgi:hypothetical protein
MINKEMDFGKWSIGAKVMFNPVGQKTVGIEY